MTEHFFDHDRLEVYRLRSNTSPMHLILRGRWRDFIAMLVISGCERPNRFF